MTDHQLSMFEFEVRAPVVMSIDLCELGDFPERANAARRMARSFSPEITPHTLPEIIVVDHGDRYEVIDGRCRVMAARIAGMQTIRAKVFNQADIGFHSVALVANAQRSGNPINEYDRLVAMINGLEGRGFALSNKQIGQMLGLSESQISRMLGLSRLITPLMSAARAGKMSASTAMGAAALPEHVQRRLLTKLETDGRLKYAALKEVRQTNRVEQLSLQLDTPNAGDWADQIEQNNDPVIEALQAARSILEHANTGNEYIALALASLSDAIQAATEPACPLCDGTGMVLVADHIAGQGIDLCPRCDPVSVGEYDEPEF